MQRHPNRKIVTKKCRENVCTTLEEVNECVAELKDRKKGRADEIVKEFQKVRGRGYDDRNG